MCLAERYRCGVSYESGKLLAFGTCCDSMQCLESSDPKFSREFFCENPGSKPPPVLDVCMSEYARCGMKNLATGSVRKSGSCCEDQICSTIPEWSEDGNMFCVYPEEYKCVESTTAPGTFTCLEG